MRHTRRRSTALTIACLALLAGCSYPAQPPGLLVTTTPPGASCTVSRLGQTVATADPTPAIARVEPADGPLSVTCRRQGFADATVQVPAGPGAPPSVAQGVDIAMTPRPPAMLR